MLREYAERRVEAAQKRVGRAVDRVRELLVKRGVTASASGLVVLLSANAVQAAPVGLALSITASAAAVGTALAGLTTTTAAKTLAMTTLQKVLIATALATAIGVGTYQARQASLLHAQVKTLQQQLVPQPETFQDAALASLQTKAEAFEAQNTQLASALNRANADKARLETEREQARRAAALYKELVEQANSKDMNPTNEYPTPRHVSAEFGRMGRLSALSKEDDSKLSPEEKSALEAAKLKALESIPNLVKAAKQYEAAQPAGDALLADDRVDRIACLFYGALNLDEQQFSQVYSVMQKLQEEAKQKGLSKETPGPEAAEAAKQIVEQFKAETQTILTPEQSKVLAEVLTHFQLDPKQFGFNFNF